MVSLRVVLASASPARTGVLTAGGIPHEVQVSDVDEDAALAATPVVSVSDSVAVLARAKAEAVAQARQESEGVTGDGRGNELILGCDSLLELQGEPVGKPLSAEVARRRWQLLRGGSAVLHTGHHLILGDRRASAVSSTIVHFADVTDAEIDAYVATGEPLSVAGAFTLDGFGGAFITGIEGDHHGVLGLSLPLLRRMLLDWDVPWASLWNRA